MFIKLFSVIRLIVQFLKENRLNDTAARLQTESNITMNCFEDREEFKRALLDGKWDLVLHQTRNLILSDETLHLLYEQVNWKESIFTDSKRLLALYFH